MPAFKLNEINREQDSQNVNILCCHRFLTLGNQNFYVPREKPQNTHIYRISERLLNGHHLQDLSLSMTKMVRIQACYSLLQLSLCLAAMCLHLQKHQWGQIQLAKKVTFWVSGNNTEKFGQKCHRFSYPTRKKSQPDGTAVWCQWRRHALLKQWPRFSGCTKEDCEAL